MERGNAEINKSTRGGDDELWSSVVFTGRHSPALPGNGPALPGSGRPALTTDRERRDNDGGGSCMT